MVRLTAIIFIVIPLFAKAQLFEAGVFIGGSNYEGDLADVAFSFREFHPGTGAIFRINPYRFVSVKSGIYYGTITGYDKNSLKPYLRNRNLSFYSNIYEFSLQLEINILGYKIKKKGFRSTPYFFTGIGIFHFDPKTRYQNRWVRLQPLGTEGQNIPQYADRRYKLMQFCMPMGLGVKFKASPYVHIGLEVGFRDTYTDYLDDVSTTYVDPVLLAESSGELAVKLADRSWELQGSNQPQPGEQRGDPTDKDWYLFAGINLTFSIDRSLRYKGIKCYSFDH